MIRRRMVGLLVGLLVVGVMLAPASASVTKSMAELLAGGTIEIGDKIFDNWGDWNVTGNGSSAPPEFIQVTASVVSPTVVKLKYQGQFSVDPGQWLDATWSYQGHTVSGEALIEDMTVKLVGFGITAAPAKINLSETITNLNGGGLLAAGLVTEYSPLYAATWNPPVAGIQVVKNLSLAGLEGKAAHVSIFEQTFSQVPEASSFALFGLGLAGLSLFRRFRKR